MSVHKSTLSRIFSGSWPNKPSPEPGTGARGKRVTIDRRMTIVGLRLEPDAAPVEVFADIGGCLKNTVRIFVGETVFRIGTMFVWWSVGHRRRLWAGPVEERDRCLTMSGRLVDERLSRLGEGTTSLVSLRRQCLNPSSYQVRLLTYPRGCCSFRYWMRPRGSSTRPDCHQCQRRFCIVGMLGLVGCSWPRQTAVDRRLRLASMIKARLVFDRNRQTLVGQAAPAARPDHLTQRGALTLDT